MTVEMNRLQYYHGRNYKGNAKEFTISCEVPTQGALNSLNGPLNIKIGWSYFNPKDMHYCRKTGREVSLAKMKEEEYDITLIRFESDRKHYYFKSKTTGHLLVFEVKENRKKIFLIDASL